MVSGTQFPRSFLEFYKSIEFYTLKIRQKENENLSGTERNNEKRTKGKKYEGFIRGQIKEKWRQEERYKLKENKIKKLK